MANLIFLICRPVEEGFRLEPDHLRSYRDSHQFLGPCCLCPLVKGPLKKEGNYCFVEAAIYLRVSGRYAGEYVIECCKGRCGYLGRFLHSIIPWNKLKFVPLQSSTRGEDISQAWGPSEAFPGKRLVAAKFTY